MTSMSAPGIGLVVSDGKIQNERTLSRYFYFVLLSHVRPLAGEFLFHLLVAIII